jgi:polyisoprenoid-binding protein YceI
MEFVPLFHFFTNVPGFFSKVKGTIVVDREHLEKSTVETVIDVASITTNTPMRMPPTAVQLRTFRNSGRCHLPVNNA